MTMVAIIDLHPIVRLGLACILADHFSELDVIEADSVSSFYKMFPDKKPDLTILGTTQSAGTDSLEAIKLLKNKNLKGFLILYDDMPNPAFALFYLKAHVHGYISKRNGVQELINCIGEVLRGKYFIGLDMRESVIESVIEGLEVPGKTYVRLTAKQFEVAKLLADGMSVSRIAHQLGKTTGTISISKKVIYKKLKVDNILKLREIVNSENPAVSPFSKRSKS